MKYSNICSEALHSYHKTSLKYWNSIENIGKIKVRVSSVLNRKKLKFNNFLTLVSRKKLL